MHGRLNRSKMMKKFLFLISFIALVAYKNFAEQDLNNVISLDISPTISCLIEGGWGFEVSYERVLPYHLSAIISVDYSNFNFTYLSLPQLDGQFFSMGLGLRYYISKTPPEGFFAGLGFEYYYVEASAGDITDSGGIPGIDLNIGYKIFIKNQYSRYIVEPLIGFK